MRAAFAGSQKIQQNESKSELAKYKSDFQSSDRLMNRGYDAEKKLRPWRIWTRQIGIVQRACFRGMQASRGRIAGNDNVGIVAKPLHASIPDIAMNVIISARGQPKKCNVPHRGQEESNDGYAPGKC